MYSLDLALNQQGNSVARDLPPKCDGRKDGQPGHEKKVILLHSYPRTNINPHVIGKLSDKDGVKNLKSKVFIIYLVHISCYPGDLNDDLPVISFALKMIIV